MKFLGIVLAILLIVMFFGISNAAKQAIAVEQEKVDDHLAAERTKVLAVFDGQIAIIARLEADFDVKKKVIAGVEAEKVGFQKQVDDLKACVDALTNESHQLNGQKVTLIEQKQNLKYEIQELQSSYEKESKQVKKLRKHVVNLMTKNERQANPP